MPMSGFGGISGKNVFSHSYDGCSGRKRWKLCYHLLHSVLGMVSDVCGVNVSCERFGSHELGERFWRCKLCMQS